MFRYLTKGKRGKIYVEGNTAIKKSLPKRVKNESSWLKILNKYGIGPKLIEVKKNYFKYKFIKGDFILDYFKSNNSKPIIIDVLKQCRMMDKLKVNKLEMHNPYKHIIINNRKPVMIDFERVYKTQKPKNVTQFCQFLMSKKVLDIAKYRINKKELIKLLKQYKKNQTEANFKKIISYFKFL
ncbi:hypothetical protein J4446_00820 [Candidatus Woesearchaeota archaeon]|nr:hypothetical protein [Candidatus Woesearchaeota archaeon]